MLRHHFNDRIRSLFVLTGLLLFATAAFSSIGLAGNEDPATPAGPSAKTISIFCRAANLPHTPLPEQRLPAEQSLSVADARTGLAVVQALSGDQTPLCSQRKSPPGSAVKILDRIADPVDPISHHKKLPARIADQLLNVRSQAGF
jgi:hypothetical protein